MYDGGSMTSPMIGEYCATTPPDIITTSNEIFVHFLTDTFYTDIGFKLMYNPTSNQHKLQFGATQSFESLGIIFKKSNFQFCFLWNS
jgi:hypothetical protein